MYTRTGTWKVHLLHAFAPNSPGSSGSRRPRATSLDSLVQETYLRYPNAVFRTFVTKFEQDGLELVITIASDTCKP